LRETINDDWILAQHDCIGLETNKGRSKKVKKIRFPLISLQQPTCKSWKGILEKIEFLDQSGWKPTLLLRNGLTGTSTGILLLLNTTASLTKEGQN
jgi:hypothetical protein